MAVEHYHGSCQCGAVAFEADLDLDSPITCNCSRCRRLGSVLVFAPAGAFRQTRGEGAMSSYRFNRNVIDHLFCPVCGIESFARGTAPDGSAVMAVNANCLDGVDTRALAARAQQVDGASY